MGHSFARHVLYCPLSFPIWKQFFAPAHILESCNQSRSNFFSFFFFSYSILLFYFVHCTIVRWTFEKLFSGSDGNKIIEWPLENCSRRVLMIFSNFSISSYLYHPLNLEETKFWHCSLYCIQFMLHSRPCVVVRHRCHFRVDYPFHSNRTEFG